MSIPCFNEFVKRAAVAVHCGYPGTIGAGMFFFRSEALGLRNRIRIGSRSLVFRKIRPAPDRIDIARDFAHNLSGDY